MWVWVLVVHEGNASQTGTLRLATVCDNRAAWRVVNGNCVLVECDSAIIIVEAPNSNQGMVKGGHDLDQFWDVCRQSG